MKSLKEAFNQDLIISSTQISQPNALRSLNNCSEKGINALDLIGEPVGIEDCIKAEEFLKMNYGVDYPEEKFTMLWQLIIEDKWTSARLTATLKWFLKNKKFPNWTIADWFDYEVRLYPHSWYLKQIHEFGAGVNKQIEKYRVNGKILYKYQDTTQLPFEYLGLVESH